MHCTPSLCGQSLFCLGRSSNSPMHSCTESHPPPGRASEDSPRCCRSGLEKQNTVPPSDASSDGSGCCVPGSATPARGWTPTNGGEAGRTSLQKSSRFKSRIGTFPCEWGRYSVLHSSSSYKVAFASVPCFVDWDVYIPCRGAFRILITTPQQERKKKGFVPFNGLCHCFKTTHSSACALPMKSLMQDDSMMLNLLT